MKWNNPRTHVLAVLLTAALTGAICLFVIQIRSAHAAKVQRKVERMVERSEALYRKTTFSTQAANLTFEEITSTSRGGNPVPHLIVSITRDTGEDGVRMVWDIRTGELIQFSNEVPVPRHKEVPTMRKDEATNMTASWLRGIGVASQSPRWKLTAGPEHNVNTHIGSYTARWRGAHQEVTIMIEDQTGELVRADIRRLN